MGLGKFLPPTVVENIGAEKQRGIDVGVFDQVDGDVLEDLRSEITRMFQDGPPQFVWEPMRWSRTSQGQIRRFEHGQMSLLKMSEEFRIPEGNFWKKSVRPPFRFRRGNTASIVCAFGHGDGNISH